MKIFRSCVFLLSMLCIGAPHCAAAERDYGASNCNMVRFIDHSTLMNEVSLVNGPRIYMQVAELYDQPEALYGKAYPTERSSDLGWVWKSNPTADRLAFILTWPKGTPVKDMLIEIARRRSERLEIADALFITPGSEPPKPKTFQQKSIGAEPGLDKMLGRLLVHSIILDSPDGEGLEDFMNLQFQRSYESDREEAGHPKNADGASPYRIKLSAAAKEKAGGVNFLGCPTYSMLFDIVSLCCGLQWHVAGNTVLFETIEEQKAGVSSGH